MSVSSNLEGSKFYVPIAGPYPKTVIEAVRVSAARGRVILEVLEPGWFREKYPKVTLCARTVDGSRVGKNVQLFQLYQGPARDLTDAEYQEIVSQTKKEWSK